MKLLKADDDQGQFLNDENEFTSISEITKEDLLRLADLVLEEDKVELDPYDDERIQNEAHRILYKSIREKLQDLRDRREEFVQECDRLYQQAYEEYRRDLAPTGDDDTGRGTQPVPSPVTL